MLTPSKGGQGPQRCRTAARCTCPGAVGSEQHTVNRDVPKNTICVHNDMHYWEIEHNEESKIGLKNGHSVSTTKNHIFMLLALLAMGYTFLWLRVSLGALNGQFGKAIGKKIVSKSLGPNRFLEFFLKKTIRSFKMLQRIKQCKFEEEHFARGRREGGNWT